MAKPRFGLPPQVRVEMLDSSGVPIRAMFAPARNARGLLLFLNGRADFLEKYAESYPSLLDAGWSILSLDWRGQGGSGRECANGAGHVSSFDAYLGDLDTLLRWGREMALEPTVAIGHSMGGHLLLRHLATPGHGIARAVLLAPFVQLAAGPLTRLAVSWFAGRQVAAGRGTAFAAGQQPYNEGRNSALRQLLLTGDARRFADEHDWLAAVPSMRLGGVSWGWLDAARRSSELLQEQAADIRLPLLMLLGERERLVSNAAARRLARRLPDCEVHVLPGAHELLREADPVRDDALSRILRFLDKAA